MSEDNSFPLIIAHRGASATAPENTIAAFRKAIEEGADGLEFDVRLTKNGVPVVFHDATLKRIANKSFRILNLTSDELQTVDAGSWFNNKFPLKANADFSRERISTLQETLNFLSDFKGLIYIELKCKNDEIAQLVENVAKVIRNSNLLSRIIVKSFKLTAIKQIKKLVPEVCTAALFAPKIMAILRKQSRLVEKAQEYKADQLSLHFSLATQKLLEKAKSQGLQTVIWTADHPVWVKRSFEIGIKGIITNNPARLLATRNELFKTTSMFS